MTNTIDESYINKFDFRFVTRNVGKWDKIKGVFKIFNKRDSTDAKVDFIDLREFVHNPDFENNVMSVDFIDFILDDRVMPRLVDENFYYNINSNKIATKDFRILIDSIPGTVPKDELSHVATVASMMLIGSINYAVGNAYIVKFMKKYGYTELIFQENGYIHIKITEHGIQDLSLKQPFDLKGGPK